jgi:hypothetical protein
MPREARSEHKIKTEVSVNLDLSKLIIAILNMNYIGDQEVICE